MRRLDCFLVCLFLATGNLLCGQAAASHSGPESGALRAYEAAVRGGPLSLYSYLVEFPKGADLHVHLSGAVYAESFIRAAGEDGLCVDPAALSFAKPPCAAPLVPASDLSGNITPANQVLYDRLVDASRSAVLCPRRD